LIRGDLVTVAMRGDYGKPRPAVVVQSDDLTGVASVVVCYVTSELHDLPSFRIDIPANASTGLTAPSQIMADKVFAIPKAKCGAAFGHAPGDVMDRLGEAMAFVLGLGGVQQ